MTIFSKWSDSDHYHFDMIYDCRFEMTYDCPFDMIYDYPFDRATVSLRPQVIKKLLPGEAEKVAYVKAH